MQKILQLIRRGRHSFAHDSLFRNSVFLIASTAIMSVLGFGFWLFVAHLYSPAEIGSASALISVTTLLGNISLLGLEAILIRFLPASKDQSRDINAALIIVTAASIISAIVYMAISPILGINISLLAAGWEKAGFVALMVVVGLNTLTDAVFIANRRAEFHTMTYTALAVVKLILPLFLVPFGSLGIFLAYAGAMCASLLLTFFLMKRTNSYRFSSQPNWSLLRQTRTYAVNNYLGHILSSLSAQVMPLLILARLGADHVAYFAMAWTMANFLYIIPTATAQSLLAEGARSPADKTHHLKHATKLLSFILVPAVAIAMLAAPYLLEIFGQQYAAGSTLVFQILALATFCVAINEVCNTILNIEHRSSGVVASQLSALVVTIVSAVFLLRYGLGGVGVSLLLGLLAANICHAVFFTFGLGQKQPVAPPPQVVSAKSLNALLRAYGITDFTATDLAEGSSNHTFLIKHSDGTHVLRIYAKQTPPERITQEVDFVRYLAAKGVPVPRLVANRHKSYASRRAVNGATLHYIVMEFENGSHPKQYTPRLINQMAAHQAAIHTYGSQFAATRRHPAQIHPRSDWLLGLAPKGFSHCDFDASNILVTGGQLSCILDFEGMRFVPLVSCLFFTLRKIHLAGGGGEDIKHYLRAYQQIRPLNPLEKIILRCALMLRCHQPGLFFASL